MKLHNPELQEAAIDEIISCCEVISFNKNDILVDYGEVCRHVYFSVTGLVTALENVDGKERNCWFMTAGDVVIAIESFYKQQKSMEQLLALEKTTCLAIHVKDLNRLCEKYPSFLEVRLKLTEYYYQQAFDRSKWIFRSAEERYALLLEHYPVLVNLVSARALASYLGISEGYLSAIKKDYYSISS